MRTGEKEVVRERKEGERVRMKVEQDMTCRIDPDGWRTDKDEQTEHRPQLQK